MNLNPMTLYVCVAQLNLFFAASVQINHAHFYANLSATTLHDRDLLHTYRS